MKKLPVGIDSFEKLRKSDFYYVDKTMLIRDLLEKWGDVNLFTRPRRFGKTLNMSMLKAFFEIGGDKSLFEGLKISEEGRLCKQYQCQYPVVFFSLKGVEGSTYEDALKMLNSLISAECGRLDFLLHSTKVLEKDKKKMMLLFQEEGAETDLKTALVTLMRMLHTHYGKQVILLIDEYDVPLDKAYNNGYYDQMVMFLRGFFGEAFKTNPDLYFAVVTGCLRISRESIFTGVNNLKVDTIADKRFDEYFGFTDEDVRRMLDDYGMNAAYEEMKEWYDGYRFGDTDVYCPWDVVNHCDKLQEDEKTRPKPYWNNTSSNALVQQFIDKADVTTRSEIEQLIAGQPIRKKIVETLTYGELEDSIENLWSVLYLTGYLTVDRNAEDLDGLTSLTIPNREVREIFIEKIQKWFAEKVVAANQHSLYEEVWKCDAGHLQEQIRDILLDTISYHDYHENYYHALLVGLLWNGQYRIRSNAEMGKGRSDIVVEDDRNRRTVIIETKRSGDYDDLEEDAEAGLEQIKRNDYAWPYKKRKYSVIAYGISFADKDCCVMVEKL